MKTNALYLLIATGMLWGLLPNVSAAADTARIEVTLVEASNAGGGVDRALQAYAGTFKRLFNFDTYQKVSQNRISLDLPGSGSANLGGRGGRLEIESGSVDGGSLLANLNWTRGGQTLLHTRLRLRQGKPAVLGGPRSGEGSYLLLIVWK